MADTHDITIDQGDRIQPRIVGISLADRERFSAHNPAGWGAWLDEPRKRAEVVDACLSMVRSGEYGGVFVAAGCGKCPPVYVGLKSDGAEALTWWAGHTDRDIHPVVRELAAAGVALLVSVGLPRDIRGLERLEADAAGLPANVELAFDISAANTNWIVPAALDAAGGRARLESRPLPGMEVERLMSRGPKFLTMPARARRLMARGVEFAGDVIAYNAGRDANAWNAAEALLLERRGGVVVRPLKTIGVGGE